MVEPREEPPELPPAPPISSRREKCCGRDQKTPYCAWCGRTLKWGGASMLDSLGVHLEEAEKLLNALRSLSDEHPCSVCGVMTETRHGLDDGSAT